MHTLQHLRSLVDSTPSSLGSVFEAPSGSGLPGVSARSAPSGGAVPEDDRASSMPVSPVEFS